MKRVKERKGPLSCQVIHETGPKISLFFSRRFKPFHFSFSDAELAEDLAQEVVGGDFAED